VPHLRLTWDAAALGVTPAEVVQRLREGEPRIEIKGAIAGGVEVAVFMLQPGEDEVVGRRLRDALRKA
jgi:L-seryl-tRNA(Ser) seleniumtransferase